MINKIEIKNFKSINEATIETAQLNLFTGLNASGKSTFLQSLLLLRQSFLNGSLSRHNVSIFLGNNDSLVNLGTFADVFSQNAQKTSSLEIKIISDRGFYNYKSEPYDNDRNDKEDRKDRKAISGSLSKNDDNIPLFSDTQFQYLSADRISPQEDFPRFDSDELLGKDGRFTPHYLEKYANREVPLKHLLHEKEINNDTLMYQVNAWMRDISPGIEIQTKENRNTNRIELSYRYRTNSGVPTQDRKPQNVGHGITPTLPIVVALLSAKEGDLIIIENPETHIHPHGQSRLAMLMAKAAQAGVQLFVESHSDHILNGIRVAAKRGWIEARKVKINYFSRSDSEITSILPLKLDQNGRIDKWPKGFFDEWDNLLDELI